MNGLANPRGLFLVSRLPNLLRYQHHVAEIPRSGWIKIHSLLHLCHIHCRSEACSRDSPASPGSAKTMADSQLRVRVYLFFLPLHSLNVLIYPDLLPTGRYKIPFTTYLSDTPKPSRLNIPSLLFYIIVMYITSNL